jgi:transcriptional regulator with XRE-family HTH domain
VNQCKNGFGQCGVGLEEEARSLAERFGRRIGRLRVAAGMSKIDLGIALGVRRQMVDRYESGLDLPRLNVALRICAVFGLEPNQLFSGLLDAPGGVALTFPWIAPVAEGAPGPLPEPLP